MSEPTTTTTTTTLPPLGDCFGAGGCSATPVGMTQGAASAEALRARLLGQWYACNTTSSSGFRLGPADAVGIEFAADGNWYFLKAAVGGLVRGTGFGDAGTYDIIDTSSMNGPGSFQINLNLNSGGTDILHPAFAEAPRLLQLLGMEGTFLLSHLPDSPDYCS